MRASSSASAPGVAPGRVDSPPISTIAQPCAAMRFACATAASAARKRPPSENESGVTLRIPMTTGRVPIWFRKSSRLARWSARIGLLPRARHVATPAHDIPFRMLVDPLREVGLRIHGALARRAHGGVLQSLLLALARLRQGADRHDDLDHVHQRTSGGFLAPLRRLYLP